MTGNFKVQDLTNEQASSKTQARGRLVLLLIVAFFALPLVLVMLMHHFDWHPGGASNGEMIAPARKLDIHSTLLDISGQKLNPDIWQDKWSMVFVTDKCDKLCEDSLHNMRQIHVSMAKDSDRVQRIFISAASGFEGLHEQYPEMLIINRPAEEVELLTKQFDLAGQPAVGSQRIYLVDPLGNLMMSYRPDVAAADIRKDLVKLLKYSWAG